MCIPTNEGSISWRATPKAQIKRMRAHKGLRMKVLQNAAKYYELGNVGMGP